MSFFHPRKIRTILHCSMYIYLESSSRLWPEKQWYPQLSIHQWPSVRLENATRKKLGAAHESLLKVGRFRFLKNHDSDSLAHFGGIGTRIGVKGIVKGIVFWLPIPQFPNIKFHPKVNDKLRTESRFFRNRNWHISSSKPQRSFGKGHMYWEV